MNVLATCLDDLSFSHVVFGAFGSRPDCTIASASGLLNVIPDGYFILADAGLVLSTKVLVPHEGVRYHPQEYRNDRGPRTPEELFNHL